MSENQFAKIISSNFLFTDHPCKCTYDEYRATLTKIISYYGKLDNLQSIYQLGSISTPGISDLDIILVFDNTIPTNYENYHHFLIGKQRYIAGHTGPFLLSKNIFNNFLMIFFPSTLQLLSGEEQAMNHFSREDLEVFRLSYSIDAAITELLWLLDRLTSGKIPVRAMLCHLFSVKYDIKSLLDIAGVQHTDGQGFIRQVENLRLNWFDLAENDAHNQIIYLGLTASKILLDVINGLGSHLKKNYVKGNFLNSFYFTEVNSIIHFTNNGEYNVRQCNFLPRNRFLNFYFLEITTCAGIPLLLYSDHNSEPGWHLRRHLMVDKGNAEIMQNCDERLLSAIAKKMRILEEYRIFLQKAPPSMSFFEGPWWNNSRLYKMKHILWKIMAS